MTRLERIQAVIDKRRELGVHLIEHPLGFRSGESVKMPRQLLRDGMDRDLFIFMSAHLIGDLRPFDKEATTEFFGVSMKVLKNLIKKAIDKRLIDVTVGHSLVISDDERVRLGKDYIFIDEFILGLKDLNSTTKIFYAFIKGFGEEFTGSNQFVEESIGYSHATTKRCIVALREADMIDVKFKRDGSKKIRIITFKGGK